MSFKRKTGKKVGKIDSKGLLCTDEVNIPASEDHKTPSVSFFKELQSLLGRVPRLYGGGYE